MSANLSRNFGERLARYLSKAQPGYQRLDTISLDEIATVLKPGDVVLVEGNTRVSIAIKYLTQSSWSHACLYIGSEQADEDEITDDGGNPTSHHHLLEADLREGVRIVPLEHYRDFNLRICRPVSLGREEIDRLIQFARSKLGYKYDLKNVVDLIRYLVQKPAVPTRYRRSMIGLGSGEPTKAICSTLIAESFQSIDYPILPRLGPQTGTNGEVPIYYKRHFTHFTPRDFDLSPYFQVIKPTLEKGFDVNQFTWTEDSVSDADSP